MTRAALLLAGVLLFSACSDSCVAEGTWISTPNGRTPVEALREGDTIYSVDTDSWALVEVTITTIRSAMRETVAFELGSRERLQCSPTHPIYDAERRSYRPAGEWITEGAGRVMQIVEGRARSTELAELSAYAGLAKVFDLSVSGAHENFIADGMLVHNKSEVDFPDETSSSGTAGTGETGDGDGSDTAGTGDGAAALREAEPAPKAKTKTTPKAKTKQPAKPR